MDSCTHTSELLDARTNLLSEKDCPWCRIRALEAELGRWEHNCTGKNGSQSLCHLPYLAGMILPTERNE